MTEFEKQVAIALAHAMDEIARVDFHLQWDDDVPKAPLAARLASRVAAAIATSASCKDSSSETMPCPVCCARALAAIQGAA